MFSTVTAAAIAGAALGPWYWVRNLREPVLFAQAVDAALGAGCDTFIELSPHPVLVSGIEQSLARAGVAGLVLPSGRRGEDERRVMNETAAKLFVAGRSMSFGETSGADPWETELPLVLSAHTPAALRERARSVAGALARRRRPPGRRCRVHAGMPALPSGISLRDRRGVETRGSVISSTRTLAAGSVPGSWTVARAIVPPHVAFVFSGQGSQWWAWAVSSGPLSRCSGRRWSAAIGKCDGTRSGRSSRSSGATRPAPASIGPTSCSRPSSPCRPLSWRCGGGGVSRRPRWSGTAWARSRRHLQRASSAWRMPRSSSWSAVGWFSAPPVVAVQPPLPSTRSRPSA